eukprot:XP_016656741.1 PREDICTED: zinc finger protein 26-like [Acyrthosiphon pisum]
MKDYIQVAVTGDADAVTSETYVENTIKNRAWYTVEDNHVSMVSKNVEKVIKVETDMLDDWMWESRIGITKDVANQSNMKLPLDCQDVADNNITLNHENTSDKIFHCNICGKSFELNHLLKNHLAEHRRQINYKTNKCTFCGKQFKLKIGLNKHIQKHHNSVYKCRFCRQNIECSKYIEHEKYHERRDQTKFDTIPNIKWKKNQEKFIHTTVGDHFQQQINIQQSSVSRQQSVVPTASQIPMANNFDILNIEQEKNLCTNVKEKNSPNQVDSVNSNESTLANKPRELMAKQNPINIVNNNIVSTVKETSYFCIKKLPNITNGFRNDDNDQTSQNNVIFICRICKNIPSTEIHAFALHMSDHNECNMHECIVCDKTFNSVVLWTHHMIYHQQQIDLINLSLKNNENIKLEPIVIQNNINIEDNTDSGTMSRMNQGMNILENIESTNIYENKLSGPVNNQNNNLINHINKCNEKKSTFCKICNIHYAHPGALTNHMRIHGGTTYKCQYCYMEFNRKGIYIMHEKTHVYKNKKEEHTTKHTLNMYECNDCGQQFKTNLSLGHHILKNHSANISTSIKNERVENYERQNTSLERINFDFVQCKICFKFLKTRKYLTLHMKLHSDVKPFKCDKQGL